MMVKTLLRCTSALTILVAAGAAQAAPLYDTIIRGGTVVDGSGAPGRRADVAIKRGHIVAVGDLAGADAANSIDAKGLVVAPGFINLHSHAEANAVATAANVLTQGITTELINSDGGGDSDIVKSLGQYGAQGLAENIGAYIGFNSVWRETVGLDDRRATEDEIKTMRGTIARNLGQGAWGVSAGLDYKPGYFASVEEVVNTIRPAAPWRTTTGPANRPCRSWNSLWSSAS